MLYFNYFTNPCQPDKGRISAIIEQPKTVWQIIKEQKVDLTMPVLCLINGAPVLRKDWGNVFDDGELISIISLPLGDWKTLGTESVTDATVNGIYKTYTYSVAQGRYEVRATRLDDKDNSSRDKTATVELFGCTNKAQALREAVYMALANRYRRRIVTFTTELEGLIPTYGDLIAITHDMAHWGSGGEIIAQDGLKLTLSEPVEFTSGVKNVLALRQKNGSLSGPYEVTATELSTEVMLKTQPSIEILTASGMERTHFAFGTTDKWSVYARVTGIRPRSNQVEITAVIEDNRVHQN